MKEVSVSYSVSDMLKEQLDERTYGPGLTEPTQQQITEYVSARFEKRKSRLSDSESESVERWICLQGRKKAIDERRCLLVAKEDRLAWTICDMIKDKGPKQVENVIRGRFGVNINRLSSQEEPSSPQALLDELIDYERWLFLKELVDERTLSDDERSLLWLRVEELMATELVEKLDAIVERTQDVFTSVTEDAPSEVVLMRMSEAYQCYQYGFYQSCVVLCRAVLEASLKERLEVPGEPLDLAYARKGEDWRLERLIDRARKEQILSPSLAAQAHKLRQAGNKCAHSQSAATSALCRDSLEKLRQILARLFR